jgi:hypothetical protein
MTHLLSYLGLGCDPSCGLISRTKTVSYEPAADDVAARMRRSMSSRGQDMDT